MSWIVLPAICKSRKWIAVCVLEGIHLYVWSWGRLRCEVKYVVRKANHKVWWRHWLSSLRAEKNWDHTYLFTDQTPAVGHIWWVRRALDTQRKFTGYLTPLSVGGPSPRDRWNRNKQNKHIKIFLLTGAISFVSRPLCCLHGMPLNYKVML